MESPDRPDAATTTQASASRDPLRPFRPEVAPCIACGYDRGGVPVGTPCPECGERSPPADSLVLPAKHAQGSRKVFAVALVLYSSGTALSLATGPSPVRWLMVLAIAFMIIARVWTRRTTPRMGYGFSVGGVTVGNSNGLVRLPWSSYQGVESHRSVVRLLANTLGATALRVEFDQDTTRRIAAEGERYRLRSRELPGASIGSRTLLPIQLCDTCGACRRVAIGGACRACGEPMPAGTRLLSGRSSPTSSIRVAAQDPSSALGVALIVGCGVTVTIVTGALSGQWIVASVVVGTVTAVMLLVALAHRSARAELNPRLRDARDRHWLLNETELRVITPLGDTIVPWEKIHELGRRGTSGRWTAVEAVPNDPRLAAETIWLASEADVEAAMNAINARTP